MIHNIWTEYKKNYQMVYQLLTMQQTYTNEAKSYYIEIIDISVAQIFW